MLERTGKHERGLDVAQSVNGTTTEKSPGNIGRCTVCQAEGSGAGEDGSGQRARAVGIAVGDQLALTCASTEWPMGMVFTLIMQLTDRPRDRSEELTINVFQGQSGPACAALRRPRTPRCSAGS